MYKRQVLDTDGDGRADEEHLDSDGDAVTDSAIIDTDGDGIGDIHASDTDGDGYYDAEEEITTDNTAMDMPTTDELGYTEDAYQESYEDSGDAAGLDDTATDFA